MGAAVTRNKLARGRLEKLQVDDAVSSFVVLDCQRGGVDIENFGKEQELLWGFEIADYWCFGGIRR